MQSDTGKKSPVNTSLEALIAQEKANKASEKLEKYIDNILNFWYYQYVEAFHTKPDTINDLFMGLRYLLMRQQNGR